MKSYLTSKEFYFDFLHTYITISIIAWLSFFSIPQKLSLLDVYVLSAFLGLFAGGVVSFIWEFGIEEVIMKIPANRKDIMNMCITGSFSGVIFCNAFLSLYFLIPMAVLSCGLVFYEVRKWLLIRKKTS